MGTEIKRLLPSDDYEAIIAANGGTYPPNASNPFATQGDLTGAGFDKNFVHNQAAPLAVWNVNHGLNKRCSVTVVNSADEIVYGDVTYVDNNNITITFSAAFAGKAYFN